LALASVTPLPHHRVSEEEGQAARAKMPTVHLLDYVAGNIRSLVNAIEKLGYEVDWVRSPEDVPRAEVRLPFSIHSRNTPRAGPPPPGAAARQALRRTDSDLPCRN